MNKVNKLTPEIVYWATGRTKIYPEAEFASNYRKIKSSCEKKEKMQERGQSIQKITENI
tara:strand:+ start:244 stop:420 length:177 start_codon:yes stop_codon:yes gene_type:complete